ncbi:hypothetical protein MSAS_01290 [Mycobacterium saskatchewanense]|uniref:Uncharacterized protein n=1 Tax=Mycobacterium saskatchewanense TaxID=220927 RepID=A0AAJ3TTW6_9MYCO|nr:hypothetical protein [Mycobacterium saskatchewanense]ORW69529.1 hypothetical protein AWC23_01130 [Mycobacterium saskatchewanense]BBX60955.1 hypothetical protein MSAS_01290 [Mycobacterium saskatchewanense]
MAYLALIVVNVMAALSALTGFWLTARYFISDDKDGTGAITTRGPWAARRGPILVAVGIGLGFLANFAQNHIPPSPASDVVVPSNATDLCDNNDGLFGLCGAGQLH